mmetsp:Transcript_39133/g.77493  ORF Transcript_39133/g.77493 Transcript_39133/m.77493 type:complete len:133 (+) Transcript_39133:76-474(+)
MVCLWHSGAFILLVAKVAMATRDEQVSKLREEHVETDPTQEPENKGPKAPPFWLHARICVAEHEVKTLSPETIHGFLDEEYIKSGMRCARSAYCYDVMQQKATFCSNCGGENKHQPSCIKLAGAVEYRCACI